MEKSYKQLRLEDRDRITEMMAEGRNKMEPMGNKIGTAVLIEDIVYGITA